MKSRTLFPSLLCMALLGGCAAPNAGSGPATPTPTPAGAPSPTPGAAVQERFRIVDGAEDGELLLAGLEENTLFRLSVAPEDAATIDGQPATAGQLADGMELTVTHSGYLMEIYPCLFGEVYALDAATPGGGSCTDLCGLYLQVLDDLWQVDPGLNSDVQTVGLDLSDAPGALTDGEKAGIAWRFGELHGVQVLQTSYSELLEGGYLATDEGGLPYWEDGCLFTITAAGQDGEEPKSYSLPVLEFNAEKWRSGLGAYFFMDCSAVWPEFGSWSGYTIGAQAIS